MGIRTAFKALFESEKKQAPLSYSGSYGGLGGTFAIPPRQNMESYLRAYGEGGWLFGCVSRIAAAVAECTWHLNEIDRKGESEEVTNHAIADLLNHPNPFQTGHDLIELSQMYLDLTGESYWAITQGKGRKEIWLVPPIWMRPVPGENDFISGYVAENGGWQVPFAVEEIISFLYPDPRNPMRGIGPTQSIGIDLDTESFSAQHNRNYFYNNADSGTVISYPDTMPKEEYERIREQWDSRHRGYGRAHKVAVLTGGAKIDKAMVSHRDMDFVNMRKMNREVILGAFGMPYSILGGREQGSRATTEADQVTFARWCVRPRLVRIREKLNENIEKLL